MAVRAKDSSVTMSTSFTNENDKPITITVIREPQVIAMTIQATGEQTEWIITLREAAELAGMLAQILRPASGSHTTL